VIRSEEEPMLGGALALVQLAVAGLAATVAGAFVVGLGTDLAVWAFEGGRQVIA
jgi:hypothetical protein